MNQAELNFAPPVPLTELLDGDTFCARLAKYLLVRRGQWVDGLLLSQLGGAYAWRSRLSDLRHAPWHLTVENQQRKLENGVVCSEYRIP